ncbi:caspase family protein [Thiolapillus sp.]|uniref:caspase family protein n=1 Tax=Thiolapillus sp. TaxID=2017437 RepID=UPI003AF988E2
MKARLQAMEANYHRTFVRIKADMDKIDELSEQAKTSHDRLIVEKLRVNLNNAKRALENQGKQIKELKNSISVAQNSLESLEKQPALQVAQAGPVIELIDPPIIQTRGNPSYQLRSFRKSRDIVGRIVPAADLKKLEVNQQVIKADKNGIFKSQITIEDPLTVVKIIATDKMGNSSILTFNLLTKNQNAKTVVHEVPKGITSRSFPSIDFGRFYALIIGNNDYASLPALNTSVNDAKAIDQILRVRYGYIPLANHNLAKQ